MHRQVLSLPAGGRGTARGSGGERRRRHGSPGDRGEPELLDDPADVRTRSAPRSRRPTSCTRGDLSVCVRGRHRADGGASLEGSRGGERRHGLAARGRRVRGGIEAARGEPQDPRPAGPAVQCDLCASAGAGWPLPGGVGRDRGAAVARPGARGPFRRAFVERERAPDRTRGRRAGRGACWAHPPRQCR